MFSVKTSKILLCGLHIYIYKNPCLSIFCTVLRYRLESWKNIHLYGRWHLHIDHWYSSNKFSVVAVTIQNWSNKLLNNEEISQETYEFCRSILIRIFKESSFQDLFTNHTEYDQLIDRYTCKTLYMRIGS